VRAFGCLCLHAHVSFQFMKYWNDYDFHAAWYEHYSIRAYDSFINFNFIQLVVTAWRTMKFWVRINITATFRYMKLCNFEKYSTLIKLVFFKMWRKNITVVRTKFLLSYPIINISCIFYLIFMHSWTQQQQQQQQQHQVSYLMLRCTLGFCDLL